MRKIVWIITALLGFNFAATAQSKYGQDSIKCRENLYIYYSDAKAGNYLSAYQPWMYVIENCPASSKNNFIFGPYILEAKIKETDDVAQKNKFRNLLMKVYDDRLVYFPGKEGYVKERKALDYLQHYPDSIDRAYQYFKEALELDQEHSAKFFNDYFILAAKRFNADVFDVTDMFRAYSVVQEGVEYNNNVLNRQIAELRAKEEAGTITDAEKEEKDKLQRELDRYNDVQSNLEKILGPIATCENLLKIYNAEEFEKNKNDIVWLQRASKMLSIERENAEGKMEDCTDNPIFFKVAEALYKKEPSVTAARAMWYMAYKNNDYSKAVNFIKEAATKEVDPLKAAEDYLRLAGTYQKLGRLSDAKSAALKAASLRKNWGKPYLLVATLYASAAGSCGENVFEKNAVYWAAIDKLQYARSIDASVSNQASKLIGIYKQQLPDKGVIFQLNVKEGDTYTIGCWINETITVNYSI